jgi:hypothetical protein
MWRAPAATLRSDGRYRATVGTLFEHREICPTGDFEALVQAACRSFDHVVRATRAMRMLVEVNARR